MAAIDNSELLDFASAFNFLIQLDNRALANKLKKERRLTAEVCGSEDKWQELVTRIKNESPNPKPDVGPDNSIALPPGWEWRRVDNGVLEMALDDAAGGEVLVWYYGPLKYKS